MPRAHTHTHIHTRARTPRVRARAHARAYARGHTAHRHPRANTRANQTRPNARARARTPTIVLFIPLVSTLPQRLLLPRSYVLLRYLHHHRCYHCHHHHHHLPALFLAYSFLPFPPLFFSVSLLRPSFALFLSLARARPSPLALSLHLLGTVRRSTFHPRSTKGRSLTDPEALARVSHVVPYFRRVHPSRRFLARVLRTPQGSSTLCVLSCRESDSPRRLLHRHAPVLRAADSAETSQRGKLPRSHARYTSFAISYQPPATTTATLHPAVKPRLSSPRNQRRDDPA